MKKGLEILIRNNPMASVREIECFLSDLEQIKISDDADINNLFRVYMEDTTPDKWLFFGLVNYIIPLNSREMVVIAKTLAFHHFTIDNLRSKNADINDVINFMHHIYYIYSVMDNSEDSLAWAKFETSYVGGHMLDSVIMYSNEKLKEYEKINNLSKEEITEYYSGLFDVMKQQDFDKVKLYIDYTLS